MEQNFASIKFRNTKMNVDNLSENVVPQTLQVQNLM